MNKKSTTVHPLTHYYSAIYRRYDLINKLFTWGMDRRWRRITAAECMKSKPARIIDLCCGTGDMTIELLKQAGSNVEVVGYDFNDLMLQIARNKANRKGYSRVDFIRGNVGNLPFHDGEFDSVTIAFGFRNLTYENPDQDKNLSEISRILKKGGKLLIVESAVPSNKIALFFYIAYLRCFLIPLGGLISGSLNAYRYLAQSSVNYYSHNEIKEMLYRYGFERVSYRKFFLGASNLISAVKKE